MKTFILFILTVYAIYQQITYAKVNCQKIKRKYSCPGGKSYPVHLTFDDGPKVETTEKILNTLEKYQIKATFFVTSHRIQPKRGNRVSPNSSYAKRIRLIRRMHAEGHTVGAHGHEHINHSLKYDESAAEMRDFLERGRTDGTQVVVDGKPLGKWLTKPELYRLPYGAGWMRKYRRDGLMEMIKEHGYHHVGWHIDSVDYSRRVRQSKEGVLGKILRQTCKKKGGIVLMHDIKTHTANNLEDWILAMKCLGHTFKPIHQFLRQGSVVNLCPTNKTNPRPVEEQPLEDLTKPLQQL